MPLPYENELNFKMTLGPLLGVESDTQYTVCCLIQSSSIDNISNVELLLNENWIAHSFHDLLNGYWFFRFEFSIQPDPVAKKEILYRIAYKKKILSAVWDKSEFKFNVPPLNRIPDIAFVSCSGNHSKKLAELGPEQYLGWENMLRFKPDFLFLTGDQVYADPIWLNIEEAKIILETRAAVRSELEKEIDKFYFNLYIESFSKQYYSEALATIPNIMTWDDHEIIDGYGSHEDAYQNSPVFQRMFFYAKRYFEYFQIRSSRNKSLLNYPFDYTLFLNIRNYSFIIPDARSHRTRNRILHENQYPVIEHLLSKPRFKPDILNFGDYKNMHVICFILPVPIAHRDYSTKFERYFGFFSRISSVWRQFDFGAFEDDDLVDHWDHPNHQTEQKKMLDLIFKFGARYKPKNLIIVSGDVHSGGASTIYKIDDPNKPVAVQIITSPIVNTPLGSISSYILGLLSKSTERIKGYILNLENFGSYSKPNITARNYVIISGEKNYPIARMYIEESGKWPDTFSAERILYNYERTENIKPEEKKEPWLG